VKAWYERPLTDALTDAYCWHVNSDETPYFDPDEDDDDDDDWGDWDPDAPDDDDPDDPQCSCFCDLPGDDDAKYFVGTLRTSECHDLGCKCANELLK
jgi:hypothetical protein